MAHKVTFYPIGNADCCQVELERGRWLLFDYADRRNPNDPADKRIDLAGTLRIGLADAKRNQYDVVAFTHADDDHIAGAANFFALDHAAKYQGGDRVAITELWVPAAMILETGVSEDARALRQEARHRLREGYGIKVFSRPATLAAWLEDQGLSVAARAGCIVDAGKVVPGLSKAEHGVEFFSHSPFAEREGDVLIDRNKGSIVVQAIFDCDGVDAKLLLTGDTDWENLSDIIRITKWHGNHDRLAWDVVKVPHHSSYLSLAQEKGNEMTDPTPEIAWLYEERGADGGILVSTSDPIPTGDTVQPPHRHAARYYRLRGTPKGGEYVVTMEHPRATAPKPLVILLDRAGARVVRAGVSSGLAATSVAAPRAGRTDGR